MKGRPRDVIGRALALMQAGHLKQAEAALRQELRRAPRDPQIAHLLGLVLSRSGELEQAEYFLQAAARDAPDSAEIRTALGNHRATAERHADAVEAYRAAVKAGPTHAPAHLGLALSLLKLGRSEEAEAAAREALRLDPGLFQAHVNLASLLKDSGRAPESLEVLRAAAARFPRSVPVLTALLSTLNYVDVEPEEIRAAAKRLAAVVGEPPVRFTNAPEPDRRLRICFISGDLRTHSVSYFLEPILRTLDRGAVEVQCYSTSRRTDETTQRLRGLCDGWTDASPLHGEPLVTRLRGDRIDIAIDLAGHTHGSRVLALAHRGAPVQATYLGYPGTTGIPAVDHRIVDAWTDPEGAEGLATETLARLERCFVTYGPPGVAPEMRPRDDSRPLTFGSFNAMGKITPDVIGAWAEVLRSVPGSRIVLKNKALGDPAIERRTRAAFELHGVAPDSIEILGHAPDVRSHLSVYDRIDISLDTFTYNGTTTTCESLWMGVPVVTLTGRTHAGRVGRSLLGAVGLPELSASDRAGFVRAARELAADAPRLASLRVGLRERVAQSPLCDAADFAAHFERALRGMWRRWCESQAR